MKKPAFLTPRYATMDRQFRVRRLHAALPDAAAFTLGVIDGWHTIHGFVR